MSILLFNKEKINFFNLKNFIQKIKKCHILLLYLKY